MPDDGMNIRGITHKKEKPLAHSPLPHQNGKSIDNRQSSVGKQSVRSEMSGVSSATTSPKTWLRHWSFSTIFHDPIVRDKTKVKMKTTTLATKLLYTVIIH